MYLANSRSNADSNVRHGCCVEEYLDLEYFEYIFSDLYPNGFRYKIGRGVCLYIN